ncbi:MAG: response regulator [Vitreoscilla sp.]|nr:response regulator [Vitreoscilla sp.]
MRGWAAWRSCGTLARRCGLALERLNLPADLPASIGASHEDSAAVRHAARCTPPISSSRWPCQRMERGKQRFASCNQLQKKRENVTAVEDEGLEGSIMKRILILFTAAILALAPEFARAETQVNGRGSVLILHSYSPDFAWTRSQQAGIDAVFTPLAAKYDLRIEYLDAVYHPELVDSPVVLDLLRAKLGGMRFRAVLTTDNVAFNFARKHRFDLLHGAPIVFTGLNGYQDSMLRGEKGITGVAEDTDMRGTVNLILQLRPETKRIVFPGMMDDFTYRASKPSVEAFFPSLPRPVEAVFPEYPHIDAAVEDLRKLPPDSAIIVMSTLRTRGGEGVTSQRVVEVLSALPVPVFTSWDFTLGHGVVGGSVIGGVEQGRIAAEMAVRVLDGEPPESMPVHRGVGKTQVFDHRQLVRFGIPASRLPPEATILFMPERTLRISTEAAWIAGGSFIALLAMTFSLILSVRRRRRSEMQVLTLNQELEQRVADRTAQLAEAQQRADAANQAKSDFLANMSHEIRTPMNAILGMTHLALQSGLTARQRNYVQKVHNSAESLLGIINDILDFSKIEAGKLDIEQVDFNLADVLDNLANVVGMKAEEKNLELLYLEPPDLPTALVGDPLRLSQVLLNLANNAVKFTDQGEVSLVLQIAGRGDDWIDLRFEVRDTGIGIEQVQRERLFQPFEQADTSTSRRHGGTGLGLAISRQLVYLMGGQLDMRSAPGRGSSFFFTLRFGLQQPGEGAAPLRHQGLLGSRALVVDDNAQAREVLVAMVQALGLQPDEAADGIEALRKMGDAGTRPYDLVLLDWKMPGMDGITCAQRIRDMARPGARSPTVLMLTAFSRDEALRRVDEQGLQIAGLLTKPVTPSSLFDACCKALGLASLASVHAERRKGRMVDRSKLSGARILLVEDNEINREVALELLTEQGITVVTAADGREALQVLERESFDAVLMDCQMPVMDGFEATRALRERPALRELPVIAMTANAMVGDRERTLAAGMTDHIAKPINIDEMFATLTKWLAPRKQPEPSTGPNGAATDFRSLPGVEVAAALARMGSSEFLYARTLQRFLDAERDFLARFASTRALGDMAAARRMAHDLQSVAGTLGMNGLRQAAMALEQACGDGDAPTVDARLHEVSVLIGPILQDVQSWSDARLRGAGASA